MIPQYFPFIDDMTPQEIFRHFSNYVSAKIEELSCQVKAGNVDMRARDYMNQTALHFAVSQGQVELSEMLLEKGAEVSDAEDNGTTPLLKALNSSNADKLVPLLMKHGADIFVKDAAGENVLHRLSAAPVEHVELARLFIEKGVSVDDRTYNEQYQPIHLAAMRNKNELVKLFLICGADVNAQVESQGRQGESLLHVAISRRARPEVSKTLLERGANIHLKTIEGITALHQACKMHSEKNIRLLLSAGADVLAEDCYGNTPFSHIFKNRDRKQNYMKTSSTRMIKALALRKACLQPTIELKDERFMKEHIDKTLWNYYQDCHASITRMKFTRFIESCTFLELLAERRDRIATLMFNPEFEDNFKLYDLNGFSMYAEDVREAFERAQRQYHFMLEWEDVINEAVYHILPDVVVRRVIRYLCKGFENFV